MSPASASTSNSSGPRPLYEVPSRVRTVVYLIGMLGFPIVVAGYVLVVLSADMKMVDKSLVMLSSRIDERPMGLDKTSDFVIYTTESLRHELKNEIPKIARELDFECPATAEGINRKINRIKRATESSVRPIVRKHRRFAERFPSAGGNLGSLYVLSAPAEDASEGDMEAYLNGQASKDLGESLVTIIVNNFEGFGDRAIERILHEEVERKYFGAGGIGSTFFGAAPAIDSTISETDSSLQLPDPDQIPGTIQLMSEELFIELSNNAIDTVVMALRDQMLHKVRAQSSEFDRDLNRHEWARVETNAR